MHPEQWFYLLSDLGVRDRDCERWADVFTEVFSCGNFELDIPIFLGQVVHESAYLQRLDENLNYSAERLTAVWPKRFPTLQRARPYARNPRALANKVYGGRLGNEEDDDGWKYRGRGLIQVTGKTNYKLVEELTGMPVVQDPDLLLEPVYALRASIAWFEEMVPEDMTSVERVTRIVNGGTHGLSDRIKLTNIARKFFA